MNLNYLCRRNENFDMQIDFHSKVNGKEEASEKTDWRTFLNFDEEYKGNLKEFLSISETHETIWHGHIGRMTITKKTNCSC